MIINAFLNAIIQIIIFAIIPFIWWLITARKKENFFSWIGLKKPVVENKKRFILIIIIVFVVSEALAKIVTVFTADLAASDSAYKGMGLKAVPCAFFYAYGQTGFSEELLFRGFLLKRLVHQFGYKIGTTITAVLFGLAHLIMVWGQASPLVLVLVVVYPLLITYGFAWLNEKEADGSIIPSFLLHGTMNFIEHIMQIFLII